MMKYTIISVQPKDAEKKINQMAQTGWKVVSQSESTWVVPTCFGISKSVDAIINITMVKED